MFGLKMWALAMTAFVLFITKSQQQATNICVGQLDLVLLVDASNSVLDANFQTQMNGITDLVQALDVGINKIRIGIVVFSSQIRTSPISGDKQFILNNIKLFQYLDESTRTDLAIQQGIQQFNDAPRAGNVPKLMVIITDGASDQPTETSRFASQAKAQGIKISTVGIGNYINQLELQSLNSPSFQTMFTQNFANIGNVIRSAVGQACTRVVVTAPTPIPTAAPTRAPTAAPVTPQVFPQAIHLCTNSGSTTAGVGKVGHHWECDKYYQCYYDSSTGFHLGISRHCPLGMYYNRQTMKCDWPANVTCPFSNCKLGCSTFPMGDTLRGYWDCSGPVAVGKCCPINTAYVSGHGCIPSLCAEPCDLGKCAMGYCSIKPTWGSSKMYKYSIESIDVVGWYPGTCPFNELDMVDCGCTSNPDHYCEPDFDTYLTSSATLGKYVTSAGALFGPNGATVGVGQHLHLYLHKSMGLEPITMRFVYREAVTPGPDAEILISSSHTCAQNGGFMQIIYNQNLIKAWIKNLHGQLAFVSVPMTGLNSNSLWKDVTFSYNNKQLVLSVKVGNVQFIEKVKAPSGITFPCGFDIGPTQNSTGFSGTMRRIAVASCFPNRFY